ncbi:MAG: hypothetical protein KTR22_13980 [Flavobacteriaceae bacterium]|nr:hypothetical protein [Flavobacteriaceae bacterium]
MRIFSYALTSILLLSITISCRVTVPENDANAPVITVSVVEENAGTTVIRSSDPSASIPDFECPAGTDNAGNAICCYATTIVGDSVDFRVIATDAGGVRSMNVTIFHNQVSNIRVVNAPEITPLVTNIENNNKYISVEFTEPRTSYILAFEVNNAGNALQLSTGAYDYSQNISSIPAVNTNESYVRVVDIQSSCSN